MRCPESCKGFTLVELLVGLTLMTLVMTLMAVLLVENSKVNREQQRTIEIQTSARSSMEFIAQAIRSAGWDPAEVGFSPVALDSTPGDGVETLDLFADFNGDGDLLDLNESMTIRYVSASNRLEVRRTAAGAWETLAVHVTNDADGDGVAEQMFLPDVTPDPTRLTVRITSGTAGVGPQGDPIRFSVVGDVLVRNQG